MRRIYRRALWACVFLSALNLAAIDTNPLAAPTAKEAESSFRRGEVIFFISYPFTFLGSLLAYNLAGAGIYAIDGRQNFVATGGGFYAAVAATAAILSFGIAMNDLYSVRAQTKANDSGQVGYLFLDYRF